MSTINTSMRTTSMMLSQQLLAAITSTQSQLLTSQNEISTGQTVNVPSDSPGSVSAILLLQRQLAERTQTDANLSQLTSTLNTTDQALSDASNLVIQAQSVASSQVGINSDASTRASEASVIDASIDSLTNIANQQFQGVPLFGGSYNPGGNGGVFVSALGGIQYLGTDDNLSGDVGLQDPLGFNANGADAFGALSSNVGSSVDLNPQATADTRLLDINGAQNQGFHKGSVVVNVDGTDVTVDLSSAATLGDVVSKINAAINQTDPSAGSLAISANGFTLTAASGHTIQIDASGTDTAAADLGINITASGGATVGGDIDPRLTQFTSLAALGVPVDFTSGIVVTQGTTTKTLDFSSDKTVQDLINTVTSSNLGLRLQVNSAGNGLDLISDVSGVNLSVGENGGTTATDLGLRTFSGSTQLSTFNNGNGISNPAGDDFQVQLHNGTTFNVNIDGATTVADVINDIKSAATAAGLNVGAPGATGTDFNIGLAKTGNGFALEDGTTGSSDFKVTQLGQSLAADNLGIYSDAGTASQITGKDNSTVQVNSVFSHLIALRDALTNNDSNGITLAGGALQNDADTLTQARANVGVRGQQLQEQQSQSADLKTSEQTMLSNLQDSDMASVITQFTQLQQQLQATLQVGAQNLQLSLLNYLH